MATIVVLEMPGTTKKQYDQVAEHLDVADHPPAGALFHVAGPVPGGWRVIDLWETKEAFERFAKERLIPAVRKVGGTPTRPAFSPVHRIYSPSLEELGRNIASSRPGATSRKSSPHERSKTVARRVTEEVFGQGNAKAVDELFAADYVDHNPLPGQAPGRKGVKDAVTILRTAFPTLRMAVDQVIAENGRAVVLWTATGTHEGEFLGAAPSHKRAKVSGVSMLRIENDKAVEGWSQWDKFGLFEQLGLIPELTAA